MIAPPRPFPIAKNGLYILIADSVSLQTSVQRLLFTPHDIGQQKRLMSLWEKRKGECIQVPTVDKITDLTKTSCPLCCPLRATGSRSYHFAFPCPCYELRPQHLCSQVADLADE
jgi:hypothetical protein